MACPNQTFWQHLLTVIWYASHFWSGNTPNPSGQQGWNASSSYSAYQSWSSAKPYHLFPEYPSVCWNRSAWFTDHLFSSAVNFPILKWACFCWFIMYFVISCCLDRLSFARCFGLQGRLLILIVFWHSSCLLCQRSCKGSRLIWLKSAYSSNPNHCFMINVLNFETLLSSLGLPNSQSYFLPFSICWFLASKTVSTCSQWTCFTYSTS